MGQNMANLRGQPEKRRKDKAQSIKGKIATKSCTKHQKGRKFIYGKYIRKRACGYKSRGYMFNVGDDSYLLGNLNERFLQKQEG